MKFIKEFPEYPAAIFRSRILHNSFHNLSKQWMMADTKLFRKKSPISTSAIWYP